MERAQELLKLKTVPRELVVGLVEKIEIALLQLDGQALLLLLQCLPAGVLLGLDIVSVQLITGLDIVTDARRHQIDQEVKISWKF